MRKIVWFSGLFILFCSFLYAETIERVIDTQSRKQLNVNLQSGGSISIQGWDKEQVKVIVDVRKGYLEEGDIRIEKRSTGVDVDISPLSSARNGGDFQLKIHVPAKYNIDLETMGGDVEIEKVEGEFRGQTMGGSLKLADLKGEVRLTTMGGNITLKNAALAGELKTMGGDIYFEDVSGDVKGTTMGGSITLKNTKEIDSNTTGEVRVSTMGGEITVDDAPQGADVHTMGGEIFIKRAKKYVKAKTMGGEIDIREIDGSVKASTMGGDVDVVMVGDPNLGDRRVDISSMGGEVTLTLPAGISADFDLHLIYTKDSKQNYQIQSDFDIKIEETGKEWEYQNGSARKEVVGRGAVNGGKHSIYVKTINGDITIKKGK